eukprot:scaffold104454_cov28-Tisochrysis_lutea.AAC.6
MIAPSLAPPLPKSFANHWKTLGKVRTTTAGGSPFFEGLAVTCTVRSMKAEAEMSSSRSMPWRACEKQLSYSRFTDATWGEKLGDGPHGSSLSGLGSLGESPWM